MSKLRDVKLNGKKRTIKGVTTSCTIGNTPIIEKNIGAIIFDGEPLYVSYRHGKTINTGNYNSEKIEFGVTLPVNSFEDIDTVKQTIVKFVEKELDEITKKLISGQEEEL